MADPGYSNPFDDEKEVDPFKDSGAGAALQTAPPRPVARPTSTFGRQAVVMQAGSSSRPTMTEEQLREWQLQLERREQQLEYKERKLEEVKVQFDKAKKPPNFPRFFPLWYHNIQEEIPEHGRYLVKRMYFGWILSVACFCLNCIAQLARIIGLQSGGSSGVDFGVSIAFLLLGPIITFVFWYRPFYYGVRKGRTISFFIFFFNFAFHCLFVVVMAIGIPDTGGAGFVVAFSSIGTNAGAGVLCLISGALWAATAAFLWFQMITAGRYYRNPPKPLTSDLEQPRVITDAQAGVIVNAGVAAAKTYTQEQH